MRTWTKFCTGLVLVAGLTPVVWAQVPGAAPPAAGGAAAAGAAAPAAAPAGPTTIWAKLGLSFEAKDRCKARFCASPIGKMAQQMLKPVNMFAGGMFDCCPPVDPADLAKPSDSAEGAAAQIKKDEAEAKARRAAVRYLGTVDCVHWPEAQDGLINALRADRNECVRLEAALALGRGCCCNRKTIEAMRLTVEGSDADGNPPENSERVKAAAAAALNHCLACLTQKVLPEDGPPQERPTGPPQELPRPKPDGKPEANDSAAYYKRVGQMSLGQIVQRARYTLDHADLRLGRPVAAATPSPARSGLVAVINRAFTYTGAASQEPQTMQEAPAATSIAIRPMPQPSVEPVSQIKPMSTKQAVPSKPAPAATPTASLAAPAQSVSVYHPSAPGAQVRKAPEPMPVHQPVAVGPSSPYTNAAPVSAQPMKKEPRSSAPAPAEMPSSPFTNMTPASPQPMKKEPRPSGPDAAKTSTSLPTSVTPVSYQSMQPESRSSGPTTGEIHQMLAALNNSLYPDQRERAASQLASVDGKGHPQAVQALVTAARKDAAPTVRMSCVRALAKMQINTPVVVDALQALRNDSDPRVRNEANIALAVLSGSIGSRAAAPVGGSYSGGGR